MIFNIIIKKLDSLRGNGIPIIPSLPRNLQDSLLVYKSPIDFNEGGQTRQQLPGWGQLSPALAVVKETAVGEAQPPSHCVSPSSPAVSAAPSALNAPDP